jgi:hypothetical protein
MVQARVMWEEGLKGLCGVSIPRDRTCFQIVRLVELQAHQTRAGLRRHAGDTLDLYMIDLAPQSIPSKFITDRVFSSAFPFAGRTGPGTHPVRIVGVQSLQVSAGGIQTKPSLVFKWQPFRYVEVGAEVSTSPFREVSRAAPFGLRRILNRIGSDRRRSETFCRVSTRSNR